MIRTLMYNKQNAYFNGRKYILQNAFCNGKFKSQFPRFKKKLTYVCAIPRTITEKKSWLHLTLKDRGKSKIVSKMNMAQMHDYTF